MDSNKFKIIDVDGRKFQLVKMPAKKALAIKVLLASKVVPFLDAISLSGLGPLLSEGVLDEGNVDGLNVDGLLEGLNLGGIGDALERIGEETTDKLINAGLSQCFEMLASGPVQVLNSNGTYGVADVEYDSILTIRLTFEAIKFSVEGFFNASRWTSMFQGLGDMFQRFAPMSMTSSSPLSSQDIGDSTSSAMAPMI